MKNPSFATVLVLLFFNFLNSTAFPSKALKVESATVFFEGAQMISTANVNLLKGENTLILTNVAGNLEQQSITVKTSKGVLLKYVTFKNDYLGEEITAPRLKELVDSIESLSWEQTLLKDKIANCDLQLSIIEANKEIKNKNVGFSAIDFQKMLEIASAKFEIIRSNKSKLELLSKKNMDLISKLKNQLNQEKKKNATPKGVLELQLLSEKSTNCELEVSYFIFDAGWEPSYDFLVNDITKPAVLYYKGMIHQSSGVDWYNISLKLSTGNPEIGLSVPELQPWNLFIRDKMQAMQKSGDPDGIDPSIAFLPPVIKKDEEVRVDSADGVDPSGDTKKKEIASLNNNVQVRKTGINMLFEVDLPYTIVADGQGHLVTIKNYDVPATYRYFAVPKLDNDVFVQARIPNWASFNLLSAQANIYYEGIYMGQVDIELNKATDTLDLSVGRDKGVIVKRERTKKYRSDRTLGNTATEADAYQVSITNTRKEKINLVFIDQIPVSNDKEIKIEVGDFGGSLLEENSGKLTWNLDLQPGEVKKMSFNYSVKFPKGKTIENLSD